MQCNAMQCKAMQCMPRNTTRGPAEWDELGRLLQVFPQPVFWQFFPGENTACSSSLSVSTRWKYFGQAPSKFFERCPKLGRFIGDQNINVERNIWELTRVCFWRLSTLPRAMNANITELMEFPCQVFSIEKSENLRKLKLSEISKMGREVTPFPRSSLTVGKPGGCPGPELSDRGQP